MEIALLTIRIFLFGIFALAAVGKFFDLPGTEKAVREFGVPAQLSAFAARALPLSEIAVSLLFLNAGTSWLAAILASALLAAFTAGMLWQIRNSNATDCHCFGQLKSEPVSGKSVARNLVLLALSAILIAFGQSSQGLDLFEAASSRPQVVLIVIGLIGAVLLVSVILLLKQVFEKLSELTDRLEVLELMIESGPVEREGLRDPASGLPIGVPVPAFEVRNLNDGLIGSRDLLVSKKPTLIVMVSPNCAPCEALLPELQEWKKELSEKLDFMLLSSGNKNDNAEKFPDEDPERFGLQEDKEISEKLGTKWTPTAILIGRDHLIASRPAAGDSAIRALINQLRTIDLEKDELAVFAGHGQTIGQKVPDFELLDLDGRKITPDLFHNRQTIVASWSTSCPHCAEMIGDLKKWDRDGRSNDIGLLVIANINGNEELDLGLVSSVVLDNEKLLLAKKFGLPGPPSAVRVNANGIIVSEPAIGAEQIWKLIGV